MPTTAEARRRATLDLLVSPWTLGPAVLGGTALAVGWAGGDPTWALAGVAGLLAGGGALATRWLTKAELLVQRAWATLIDEERAEREAELDRLDRALQRDGDPGSQKLLRALRKITGGLAEDEAAGKLGGAGGLLKDRADEVFEACVAQLRRSLELDETARTLSGDARRALRADRQAVLREVADTVSHLARTVTEARAAPAKRKEGDLGRLRAELDATMEVARRTERRLGELGAGDSRLRE